MDALDRFFAKVDVGDCWLWTAKTSGGYAYFWYKGKNRLAHRWIWEQLVGPIPDGLDIDHLCRVRRCVNPDHLQPVTERENALRGFGLSGKNARKRQCKRGHALSPENVYILKRGDRRERHCKTCMQARKQRFYEAATCSRDGCDRNRFARGLCGAHYQHVWKAERQKVSA